MTTSVSENGPKPATAARIYDYILGGTHNFPADREAAKMLMAAAPLAPAIAKANRAYLRRVVKYLTEQGIRQFLDIGSGIPTAGNVHEIAQAVPDARVVYVDIDPVAVMESLDILGDNSRATAIRGDLREIDPILAHPDVQRLIDFNQPVAVLIVSMLHFVSNDDEAYGSVDRLISAMVPGSHLVLSHGLESTGPVNVEGTREVYRQNTATPLKSRTREEIQRFLQGMEIVEPGVVWVPEWRPAADDPTEFAGREADCGMVAAVGRRR